MKPIHTLPHLLVFLLLFGALSSCSSSQNATKKVTHSTTVGNGVVAAPEQCAVAMLTLYQATPWQRVKMPISVSISSPASLSASGQLTMERGRSISLSMRILGMEVAALYLQPDSVTVIDRWNKRYLQEDLTRLLAGFPVDINNVQDIFLGRIFTPGHAETTVDDLETLKFESDENGAWGCKGTVVDGKYEYAFVALQTTLAMLRVQTASGGGAEIEYGDPDTTPCGPVASEFTITSRVKNKNVEASMKLRPAKAIWDADVSVTNPRIPADYKRIDGSSLLKKLAAQ